MPPLRRPRLHSGARDWSAVPARDKQHTPVVASASADASPATHTAGPTRGALLFTSQGRFVVVCYLQGILLISDPVTVDKNVVVVSKPPVPSTQVANSIQFQPVAAGALRSSVGTRKSGEQPMYLFVHCRRQNAR